eukprot:253419_1
MIQSFINMISICYIILCTFIYNADGSNIYCINALQCTQDINSAAADFIYGHGYKSVFQSPSATSHYRGCGGGFSCAQTPYINSKDLICGGTYSCSNTQSIQVTQQISATGSNALMNANISFSGFEVHLICDGDKSCAHSTISCPSDSSCILYARGALSLFEATVNVTNASFSAYFYGYYAGYTSSIYCTMGSICNIYCGHNGCDELSVICDLSSLCSFDNQPNHNPIVIDEILLWNSNATVTSNDEKCSLSAIDPFDNYREHYQFPEYIVVASGPICCRAYQSCYNASILYNNTSLTDNSSVVCNGESSCQYLNIISNGNLSVECSAAYSCIYGIMNGMNTNDNIGRVYCFGYYSCGSVIITKITNIYCTGYMSCANGIITSLGTNIIVSFTGYWSGYGTVVTCNENDYCVILCNAEKACLNMQLNCNGTCVVECNENTDCPIGWTSNPTISQSNYPSNY